VKNVLKHKEHHGHNESGGVLLKTRRVRRDRCVEKFTTEGAKDLFRRLRVREME